MAHNSQQHQLVHTRNNKVFLLVKNIVSKVCENTVLCVNVEYLPFRYLINHE